MPRKNYIPEVARNSHVNTVCNTGREYRDVLDFIGRGLIDRLLGIYQGICHSRADLDQKKQKYYLFPDVGGVVHRVIKQSKVTNQR